MNKTRIYFLSVMFIFLWACGGENENPEDVSFYDNEFEQPRSTNVDLVKVGNLTEAIITSIPSSPEVQQLFNEMGMEYRMDLLNPIEHVSKYQLISDKAINLGIYLCDVGYISAFDQTQELIFYINCTKKLSEGIGVSEIINEETIENLEMNIDDQDSLQSIVSRIYDQTYVFLDENNRLNTATLLVSGGWIEGIYIATQIVDVENPHPKLIDNLIRQQKVYDQLMELLGNFKDDPPAYKLRNDLKPIGPVIFRIRKGEDNTEALIELREAIAKIRKKCIVF